MEKVYIRLDATDSIYAEVNAYTNCISEYIPKMLYSGYNEKQQWCLILEFADGGTLQHHINNNSNISFEGKRTIAYQLALALECLHRNKLTHGYISILKNIN